FSISKRDLFPVRDQLIWHPASLGALPAIGRTSPQRLARQTLSRISHAQRAMNKDLEGEFRGSRVECTGALSAHRFGHSRLDPRLQTPLPYFFNLLNRTFSREHDQVAAQFARKLHATRAGNGHLR